ncbi:2Fe-2S ferredoxin-type domain-containing protein [Chaetomium fimeti]|uniref:2Fe-2S ferredoxin-type domain-containing protein n=1 Tax=Chaetomium fimeti TaxID=1854472 RepID=A0AAE0LQW5_9PEZI|nr:2Fe-2S ferredoxin-type domain-containing protein [Chaetomium fimeti]
MASLWRNVVRSSGFAPSLQPAGLPKPTPMIQSRCSSLRLGGPSFFTNHMHAAVETRGDLTQAFDPTFPRPGKQERTINFIDPRGMRLTCRARDGQTLLDIAKAHGLEVEGACQGECACSTCHIIVTDAGSYGAMPPATEREDDMLDLAHGLTPTSRLGCQVLVSEALDGVEIKLPGLVQSK